MSLRDRCSVAKPCGMCGENPVVRGKNYCSECWAKYLRPMVAQNLLEVEEELATVSDGSYYAPLERERLTSLKARLARALRRK